MLCQPAAVNAPGLVSNKGHVCPIQSSLRIFWFILMSSWDSWTQPPALQSRKCTFYINSSFQFLNKPSWTLTKCKWSNQSNGFPCTYIILCANFPDKDFQLKKITPVYNFCYFSLEVWNHCVLSFPFYFINYAFFKIQEGDSLLVELKTDEFTYLNSSVICCPQYCFICLLSVYLLCIVTIK